MFKCKYCGHNFGRQSSLTIHQRNCAYKDKIIGIKRCNKCNRLLPLSEFNKENRTYDSLNYECKNCIKVYINSWKSDIINEGISMKNLAQGL